MKAYTRWIADNDTRPTKWVAISYRIHAGEGYITITFTAVIKHWTHDFKIYLDVTEAENFEIVLADALDTLTGR